MDLELTNKSVLVLAGSKGLGRAAATQFVAEGANVITTSSDPNNLTTAVEDIRAETGCDPDQIDYQVCDLTDPDSIETGVTTAIDSLGGLDLLVTNHGGPASKLFANATLEEFDDAYQAILRSTIQACKIALPYLRNDGGSITNLVAASALEPNTYGLFGNVFRSGIYGLSKTLSRQYGDDVRVNCVAPRGVHTERIDHKITQLAENEGISVEEATAQRENELPLSRLGSPEEFGRAVAFIASPAAGFTTGAILTVDGGWSEHAY